MHAQHPDKPRPARFRPYHGLVMARGFAWLVVVFSVSMFIPGIIAYYRQLSTPPPAVMNVISQLGQTSGLYAGYLAGLLGVFSLVCFGVALLLIARKPNDLMVLFTGVMLCLLGAFNVPYTEALRLQVPALDAVLVVMSSTLIMAFVLFLFLFPNGRVNAKWEAVLAAALLLGITVVTGVEILTGQEAASTWYVALLSVLALSVISQAYRLVRTVDPVQRQQTKWVVFGLVIVTTGQLVFPALALHVPHSLSPAGLHNTPYDLVGVTGVTLAYLAVPVTLGVAVARYRLWAVDLLLHRALVYGALSVFVSGVHLLLVSGLVAQFTGQNNVLLSLVTVGAVAVLFEPLRQRLQRLASRIVYGQRDEPYAVLSQLARQLAGAAAPEEVLDHLVLSVRTALKLPYVAVAVKVQDALSVTAASGTAPQEVQHLPLRFEGETFGQLIFAARVPGETLNSADQRLLADVAGQAGAVVRAVQLKRELQRARERLVSLREEERRRLRRDLHDGLGPALAAQTLKLGSARLMYRRDPASGEALLLELEDDLASTVNDIRRLVHGLRPPALDDLGLLPAIQDIVQRLEHASPTTRFYLHVPASLPSLPAAVEVACYRIVQEALTNVARHARATTCRVSLTVDRQVCVEVRDNGIGQSAWRTAGVGLLSMRERAEELGGSVQIESVPSQGTCIRACLPLPEGV